MAGSRSKSVRLHYHDVELTESQIRELKAGKYVTARTSHSAGHSHEITFAYEVAHYANNISIEHCESLKPSDLTGKITVVITRT